MTLINVKAYARNRGIRIRGSMRTARLKKKRFKHLDQLIAQAWREYGYELTPVTLKSGKVVVKWRKKTMPKHEEGIM